MISHSLQNALRIFDSQFCLHDGYGRVLDAILTSFRCTQEQQHSS